MATKKRVDRSRKELMTAGRDAAKIATENSSLRRALESMRDRLASCEREAYVLESQLTQLELDNITLRGERDALVGYRDAIDAGREKSDARIAEILRNKDAEIDRLQASLRLSSEKLRELDYAGVNKLRARLRAQSDKIARLQTELSKYGPVAVKVA